MAEKIEPTAAVLDDLPRVRRQVERLERESSEAAGARKQLLRGMQERHGVTTETEGAAKLLEYDAESSAVVGEYTKTLTAFKKKHAAVLEESGGD